MATDNLTNSFKAELEKQGIVATDLEIQKFLKSQQELPKLDQSGKQPSGGGLQSGQTLMDLVGGGGDEDMSDLDSDQKAGLHHFVGAGLWSFMDSALLGIPGLALGDKDPYSWDKLGTGAKAGKVIGEAAGFLVPMKYIGLGVRGLTSMGKMGTRTMINKAAKAGSSVGGLNSEIAEKTILKTLKEKGKMTKEWLPKFSHSWDEVDKIETMMKGSLAGGLKEAFPYATKKQLKEISDTAFKALKEDGIHINGITEYLETALNTTFSVADKSKITKYIARVAESTTNFGIYNLMHDGIHSMAGKQEFDPVRDVKDAFVFSSLLPAVEAIKGGGKVKIIPEAWSLRNVLNSFKKQSQKINDGIADPESVTGLLKILTRDTYLKDTLMGKEASKLLRGKFGDAKDMLTRQEAIDAYKRVTGMMDIPALWKDFGKYAKDDLVRSLGRMMVGGAYFNSHTIFDYNMLRNTDPETLGAHLLTGMMFTKVRKPLFPEKYPTLNNFQERRMALEYFGIDASKIEHLANGMDLQHHIGATYTGLLNNETSREINRIINLERGKSEAVDGKVADYNLVKWAFGIYDVHELSKRAHEPSPEIPVNLENLSTSQLKRIDSSLREIVINEKGDKLTEDNFHTARNQMLKGAVSNVGIKYMESVLRLADELGVKIDHVIGNEINIDKPIGIGRLENLESLAGRDSYKWVNKWNQMRELLIEMGFLKQIEEYKPVDATKLENLKDKSKDIETDFNILIETIKNENYGEKSEVDIKLEDNGFLDALAAYRLSSRRDSFVNIVDGKVTADTQEGTLRNELLRYLGNRVPKMSSIKIERGSLSKQKWRELKEDKVNNVELVREKLENLIRIWGTTREDGELKRKEKGRRNLTYNESLRLIEQFESEGFILDSRAEVESTQKYILARMVESANVTTSHKAALDNLITHGVMSVKTNNSGRKILEMPSRNDVEAALERDLGDRVEVEKHMEYYDKVMEELGGIKGKYMQVVQNSKLNGKVISKLADALYESYTATKGFEESISDHFNTLRDEIGHKGEWLSTVNDFLEQIKTEETKGNTETWDIRGLNEKDANTAIVSLKSIIEQGQKLSLIDKDSYTALDSLLKNLSDKMTIDKANEGEIKSLSEQIYTAIESELGSNTKLNRTVNSIVFDMAHFSKDRLLGRARLDSLLKELREELGENFEWGEDLDVSRLEDVAHAYVKTHGSSKFATLLANNSTAWRMSYNHEEYMDSRKELGEIMRDFSTSHIDQAPKFSSTYVSQKYGEHRESLKSTEYTRTIEELQKNYEGSIDENLSSSERKSKKEEYDRVKETLWNDIQQAILTKHGYSSDVFDVKLDMRKYPKAKQELMDFHDYIWKATQAQLIGTTKVETVELTRDMYGNPVLVEGNQVVGKGQLSTFLSRLERAGVRIALLKSTGIHDGKKMNVDLIPELDVIIEGARGQESLKEEEGKSDVNPWGNGVRVITSHNNTLVVKTKDRENTLGDVKESLHTEFTNWYNEKMEYYKENEMTTESNHLKSILGYLVKSPSIAPNEVRNMVRALYTDAMSSKMFDQLILSANSAPEMAKLGESLFKYTTLAEATGAKTQASLRFVEEMLDSPHRDRILDSKELKSFKYFRKQKGKLNVVAVADESFKTDPNMQGFNARSLVDVLLREAKEQGVDTSFMEEMLRGDSSLNSSAIDATSILGTHSARVFYAHRGRKLGDKRDRGNTGGVKPSGYMNNSKGTVLLKTDFSYNEVLSPIMDKLGIDILTTQSAAKQWNAEYIEIGAKDLKNAKSFEDIISNKFEAMGGKKGLDPLKNEMSLEDFFIGKTEDAKSVTNVTYAMTDFFDAAALKSFVGDYVSYEKKIKEKLGNLGTLINAKLHRGAIVDHLINNLREDGALFEDGQTGLLADYMKAGLDPASVLVKDQIERIALRDTINKLRKPTTEGASYSILVPYLEGTASIYDKNNKQIIFGGKKLSFKDGQTKIENWNNVKYIYNINYNGKRRDIQLSRDKEGKWLIDDPYNEIGKKSKKDSVENKRRDKELRRVLTDITSIERSITSKKKDIVNYSELHDEIKNFNKDKDNKFYLHSLTLRMPNLANDTAIHRIEDYYDQLRGNVVGVNMVDLAIKHQGDFDVDAALSYHNATGEIARSVFKTSGTSPDAFIYGSSGHSMDFFGNGNTIKKAGINNRNEDPLQDHLLKYNQAKRNFGVVKRLSTSISAAMHLESSLRPWIGDNAIDIPMLRKSSDGFPGFIQRYKNVLQSIIDSTKKPNFVSEAKDSNEVLKWILFGKEIDGSDVVTKNKKKYNEQDYQPLFDLAGKGLSEKQTEVMQDAIIVALRETGQTTRFLSDVFDESGRRPPDATEIAFMRGRLKEFKNNPNRVIMRNLLSQAKYRDSQSELYDEVIDMFYTRGKDTYEDKAAILKDVKKNKFRMPAPRNRIFQMANTKAESSPANHIIERFNKSYKKLNGWTQKFNKKYSMHLKESSQIINDAENISALMDPKNYRDFTEQLESIEKDSGLILRLTRKGKEFIYSDPFESKKPHVSLEQIQNYSILYHMLKENRNSLQNYINRSGSYESATRDRALSRLTATDGMLEYLRRSQDRMFEYIESNKKEKKNPIVKHFYFQTYKPNKKGGKRTIYNNEKKPIYIYEQFEKNGILKFRKKDEIRPGQGKSTFSNSMKYIALKNPIRYNYMSKADILDSYALFEVTSNVTARNVLHDGYSEAHEMEFYSDVENLKRNIGDMAREVYDLSKKNPNALENWAYDIKFEDQVVREFFNKYLRNISSETMGEENASHGDYNRQKLDALARYLMKPNVQFGDAVRVGRSGIDLPMFKINKRLVNAVARYLKAEGESEIFENIFDNYGKRFRMKYDNIIPEDMASMYKSDLPFFKRATPMDRHPLWDLVMGTEMMYYPAMFHVLRSDMRRSHDKYRRTRDELGEYEMTTQFGTYDDVRDSRKVQLDPKEFLAKKEEKFWECG